MGAVYLAFDERLQRRVALKQVRPDTDRDPKLRELLRREARAVARLSHPNIVQVYDLVTLDDDWIVMEFVEGDRLDHRFEAGNVDLPRLLALALDIAKGLAAAHAQGIVHRDLKASNVLITSTGEAKILDFGVAKISSQKEEHTLLQEGKLLGTPGAMSPEQATAATVDHRSDLFSFGTLLYTGLTGVSPFRSDGGFVQTLIRVCVHQQKPARTYDPRISRELSDLVDRLLEKDPSHRPQSAEEVIVELQGIAATTPAQAKVLFVDDEPIFEELIRQYYRKQISSGEISVDFARDGHEALRKLEKDEEIAVVMSDLKMPGMDGLTFLGQVRDHFPHLVTVVVSAYGDMDNLCAAMNCGCFDFLIKPFELVDLDLKRKKAIGEVERIREQLKLREENVLLNQRNRFIRDAFARHLSGKELSPDFAEILQDLSAPGRKYNVTVLKSRVLGFKALPDRLPAAELYAISNRLLEKVVGIALDHGGALADFRAGEWLVLFGLPVPRENDAQRAADCSKALEEAIASISSESVRCGGPELIYSAGIDSGDVIVEDRGEGGPGLRITGPAVARAAHIESCEESGAILLSETTIGNVETGGESDEETDLYRGSTSERSGPGESTIMVSLSRLLTC